MRFREHVLHNGLEIIAECNDQARSTAIGFVVQAGSRDEADEEAGVSHFLEHMAFKGTDTQSADDVNRAFDEMGALNNAFTNEEATVYYAAVLPEFQDATVTLLAGLLRPSLREEDFETEKQVILEEIFIYEDQPPFGADDLCRARHFGAHPLGRSVLGTAMSIGALSVDQMRRYADEKYVANRVLLTATGNVDFDRLVEVAEAQCGLWASGAAALRRVNGGISPPASAPIVVSKESSTQQYLLELAAAPSAESDARYAAKLLAMILGDDCGSRLYWSLVDPGKAEHAVCAHQEHADVGIYSTYLACAPEDAKENMERVAEIYEEASRGGITQDELAQAKSKAAARVVLGDEKPRSRLFPVALHWMYRREYLTTEATLRAIEQVTLDDVHDVLEQFPPSVATRLTIGPLQEGALARPK